MVDWALVEKVVNEARGVAVPVSSFEPGSTRLSSRSALLVENAIPEGSTWDGSERPVPVRVEATAGGAGNDGGRSLIARMLGLPAASYLDPAAALAERKSVFHRSWQFVCHVSDLPAPGTAIRFDCAGLSAVVLRGRDGGLHGYRNVCRHRGSRLVDGDAGTRARLLRRRPVALSVPRLELRRDGGARRACPSRSTTLHSSGRTWRCSPCTWAQWRGLVFVAFDNAASWTRRRYRRVRGRTRHGVCGDCVA